MPLGYCDLDAKILRASAAVYCVLIYMVSYLAASWTIVIEDLREERSAYVKVWRSGNFTLGSIAPVRSGVFVPEKYGDSGIKSKGLFV